MVKETIFSPNCICCERIGEKINMTYQRWFSILRIQPTTILRRSRILDVLRSWYFSSSMIGMIAANQ